MENKSNFIDLDIFKEPENDIEEYDNEPINNVINNTFKDSIKNNHINEESVQKLCKYFEDSMKQEGEYLDEDLESKDIFLSFKNGKNKDNDLISELSKINDTQYLEPKQWKYNNQTLFEEINNKYNTIIKKFKKEEIIKLNNKLGENSKNYIYKKEEETRFKINEMISFEKMLKNVFNKKSTDYEYEELEKYIYKFRCIFKDNNNFFRCVIFAFLENIILANNIMFLKEFLVEIDDKISINNNLIKNNDYLQKELKQKIKINLIKQLLYILIKYMSIDIRKSYEAFIKIYLLYDDFDYGMIFIIRILLHEYINENKYKLYSEENKVEILSLLPYKYNKKNISDEEKYELFYKNELLNMDSYDCKIIFYLIPYLFDINLKIINYYEGTKNPIHIDLYRNQEGRHTLELFSYKGNFDICYNKKYYDLNSDIFKIFEENQNENILLEENSLDFKEDFKNEVPLQDNLKINNINDKSSIKEGLIDNYFICDNCSKKCKEKENKVQFCHECLNEIFNNDILKLYGLYLKYVDHRYKNYSDQIDKYFGAIIRSVKIKDITFYEVMAETGFLVYEILKKVKMNICLMCQKDTVNNYYYILPCECRLCSKKCFKKYIDIMMFKDIEKFKKNDYKRQLFLFEYCICGKRYYYDDILTLYIYFKNKNKIKNCEMLIKIVKNRWKWRCIKCDKLFDPFTINYRLSLFDIKINKDFYDAEIKHLICSDCYDIVSYCKKKNINCIYCKSTHVITYSERLNYENEADDLCCFI